MKDGNITSPLDGEPAGAQYWFSVEDDEPYAQGDVLRSFGLGESKERSFGLIITADCDIVQAKATDRMTYLEVVASQAYLERVWIPDQLQKYVSKQARVAAEGLSGVMRRSELSFELSEHQLLDWLRRRPVEAIDKAVNRTRKPLDKKLEQRLNALRCALGVDVHPNALSQWRALRGVLGETDEKQSADIATAMAGGGGFPDFFLLPELPGASGVGYVVLLRFIRTVHSAEIFKSEVDARVEGRPDALHRVGRLTDDIRFSITQKLAFLFSRIGLPSHFEDACRSAAALAAESLFTGA